MTPSWWNTPPLSVGGAAEKMASDEYRRFLFGTGEPPAITAGVDPATATSEPVIGIVHQGAIELVSVMPRRMGLQDELAQLLEKTAFRPVVLPPGPHMASTIAAEIIEHYTGEKPTIFLGGHHQKSSAPAATDPYTTELEQHLVELRYDFKVGAVGPTAHVNCRNVLAPVEPPTPTEKFAGHVDRISARWNLGPATITWGRPAHVDRITLKVEWPLVNHAPFDAEISSQVLADDPGAVITGVLRDLRFHIECEVIKPPVRAGWDERPIDMATTVIGYRAFALRRVDDHARFQLTSSGQGRDTVWTSGVDLQAKCLYERHPAPAPGCHCGFNCFHRLSHLLNKPDTWGNVGAIDAIGVVQAWGAIEVHGEGFRAEHVRPLALLRFPRAARIETQCHGYGDLGNPDVLEAAAAASGLPVWDALDHRDQLEEFGAAIPPDLLPEDDTAVFDFARPSLPGHTYTVPTGTVLRACPECGHLWPEGGVEILAPVRVHCGSCHQSVRIEALG